MCTLVVYVDPHPALPLLIAANRDEFLSRPTAGAQVVARPTRLLAGVDLVGGGSWLGINEYGVVIGVLNRRTGEGRDPSKQSRGLLCTEGLRFRSAGAAKSWFASLPAGDFNPCSLLLARAGEGAWVMANAASGWREASLGSGVHVLTNRPFEDLECPRRARAVQRFEQLLPLVATGWSDRLLPSLREALADHGGEDGYVARVWDETLCVHLEGYGTRSASVLAVLGGPEGKKRALLWVSGGPPCTHDFDTCLSVDLQTTP